LFLSVGSKALSRPVDARRPESTTASFSAEVQCAVEPSRIRTGDAGMVSRTIRRPLP
jgi:hypothetical protein